jgi:hypothetical protein
MMSVLRTGACLLAALAMTALALAGCTTASQASGGGASHADQQAPATGHLTGTFVIEGGPLGPGGQQPGERPIPGTVTVTSGGHHVVTIQVGGSGRFSAWLPPGRYQVSGRSPNIEQVTTAQAGGTNGPAQELPCSPPLTVTITARHTSTMTLACPVP